MPTSFKQLSENYWFIQKILTESQILLTNTWQAALVKYSFTRN